MPTIYLIELLFPRRYSSYYRRLVYAFNSHEEDEEHHLDMEQAQLAMAVDWQNDSGGDGSVTKQVMSNKSLLH